MSKLTAILKDYKELVRMTSVLNSQDVIGFTNEQIDIQLNTLSRKLESLYSNIQGLFMDIGNNGGLNGLKTITDYLNNIISGIREINLEWGDWIKNLVEASVIIGGLYKGIPFVFGKLSEAAGRMEAKKNTYQYTPILSNASNSINDKMNDKYVQGIYSINANTVATNTNTQSKNANKVATTASATATNLESASKTKDTANTEANTVAKNANTVATSRMAAISKTASVIMAGFGGPVGLAITALSIVIPLVLEHAESLGEEKNAHEQLIDVMDEENAKREQIYNSKMRSIDAAENLARQYTALAQEANKAGIEDEKRTKINEDLNATFEALQSVIEGLSNENNKYTVEADANGKIIIKLNGQIVNSFGDLKAASTETTKAKLEDDINILKSEKAKTDGIIQNIKTRIEQYKNEADALNALQKIYWKVSKAVWSGRADKARQNAENEQNRLDTYGNNWTEEQKAWSKQYIANQKAYAETAENEALNEQGKLGDTSGLEQMLNKVEQDSNNLSITISEKEAEMAQLQNNINNNRYDTGGADSNRGNLIAEPPEEKKKGKSKAEKEAEKLARQQENLDKCYTRIGLIGEQSALNYSLRRTSFGSDTGIFSSGNSEIDDAIAQAAQKYSLDEKWLHALVQKESSYNTRAGEGTNYKGLMQISADKLNAGQDIWDIKDNIDAGARYFKQMLEMANGNYRDAYVKYNAGPYAGYSSEAETNADKFQELYNKIVSGTSDFGTTTSLDLNSNISEASKWADEMAAQGKYYGENGCTAFVKAFLEQAGNSFAEDMSLWTPDLLEQAKQKGLFKNQSNGFNAGDVVIVDTDGDKNEPDHVVIADGKGGYWGNSNSNQSVVHGNLSDFNYVYGGIATGSANSYQASLSSTSLASSAGFVYNLLKDYGVEMEKLNMLADATNIPSMIAATDRAGMNVTYGQKVPIAGDILYGDDGKAYVVRSNGGYISSSGETGKSWKDISNLTDTYTSFQYATGVDLENAGSKLGGLKLSEAVENLVNMRVDREYNAFQKIQEDINKGNQKYGFKKSLIENRRSLSG